VSTQLGKILAIQFKYFGDAVLMTPALRALREHFPQSEIHLLVPAEIAPLFQHLLWLNRVWPMPRRRGSASVAQTWPVIRALRREKFDRSVDFAGNDRGAILSFLIGARQRLGLDDRGGFLGRRFCYNQHVPSAPLTQHESLRLAHVGPIAASQPKKDWPVRHWAAFYQLAVAAGRQLAFTTAKGAREQMLMAELRKVAPQAPILPVVPELAQFLALLKRAEAFISGDTGPLHFAAGLGVPTISLFGPSSATRWAPVGERHRVLTGTTCSCDGNASVCHSASHCLAAITPDRVFEQLKTVLAGTPAASG
jgi:ADP-heptose:LPS heptosyltransferase